MLTSQAVSATGWTLEEALELVRTLQLGTREFNYHLALGGSTLNQGRSEKDVDLYFLPMDDGHKTDPLGLAKWLRGFFLGGMEPIGENYGEIPEDSVILARVKTTYLGKRVDLFILGTTKHITKEDMKKHGL